MIIESTNIVRYVALIGLRWALYLVALRLLFIDPAFETNKTALVVAVMAGIYNLVVSIPTRPLGVSQMKPIVAFLDCVAIGSFIIYSPIAVHPHYWLFFYLGPIYYLSRSNGTDGGLAAGIFAGGSHALGIVLHNYMNDIALTGTWQPAIGFFFLYMVLGFIVGYSTEKAVTEAKAREKTETIVAQLSATVRFLGVAAERARQISEQLAAAMSLMGGATTQASSPVSGMDEVLDQILRGAVEVLRGESGYIMMVDQDNAELILKSSFGTQFSNQPNYPPARLKLGEDLGGWIAEKGQPLLLPKNKPLSSVAGLSGATAFFDALGVPIKIKDEVVGVIVVNNKRHGETFSQDDLKLLGTIAGETAMVVINSQLYEETMEKQVALDRLIKRVRNAQEDERRRIARDLHDGIAQNLAGLILEFDYLKKTIKKDPEKGVTESDRLENFVKDTVVELRKLIYDLRPTTLDTIGLLPTLNNYVDQFGKENNLAVEKHIDIDFKMPESMETNIFRFVQEALNNIKKHAHAKKVSVSLSESKNCLTIVISDDGKGFNVRKIMPTDNKAGGFGLFGMKERVDHLKGSFNVESDPGKGTTITANVPLESVEPGVTIEN